MGGRAPSGVGGQVAGDAEGLGSPTTCGRWYERWGGDGTRPAALPAAPRVMPPAAPTDLAASILEGGVHLTWKHASDNFVLENKAAGETARRRPVTTLLPVRLHPIPERARAETVAWIFCEMIAEDEDLRAQLREVDAPSRPETHVGLPRRWPRPASPQRRTPG